MIIRILILLNLLFISCVNRSKTESRYITSETMIIDEQGNRAELKEGYTIHCIMECPKIDTVIVDKKGKIIKKIINESRNN